MDEKEISIPRERIEKSIMLIRGEKILLDRDLAELYRVKTKVLKQAVRRNIKRFPSDFMFELSKEEFDAWRSQFVTSNSDKMGLRYKPMAFTEQGVAMLSSVLKSPRAIQVNIAIIRALMTPPEKPRKKIYPVKSMSPPAGVHYQDGSTTLNLPRVVNFI